VRWGGEGGAMRAIDSLKQWTDDELIREIRTEVRQTPILEDMKDETEEFDRRHNTALRQMVADVNVALLCLHEAVEMDEDLFAGEFAEIDEEAPF
jgi:hypothetical protein